MDERILEFIGDLRRAEVRVSTTEALDALQAASAVGLQDRGDFRQMTGTRGQSAEPPAHELAQ